MISAAFIGPGTVTTAASSGAGYGYALIWALIFSTFACYILQETSARITVASGKNLGEAMRLIYGGTVPGKILIYLSLAAIITGCAAFEAGNILGAAAGIKLVLPGIPNVLIVSAIGLTAGLLLWAGSVRQIALVLGVIVAFLGVCFLITAFMVPADPRGLITGAAVPSIPSGSELLVLGLIGTTVVPYNLFLGSGMKHGQTAAEMKVSLFIAIGLGGLISIAVLITGTAIAGSFTFGALADELARLIGPAGPWLLGAGLFGAGLSSTLTAALAASVTASSIFGQVENTGNWTPESAKFRLVWGFVLVTGMVFGLLQVQPVPVIILAQALNGVFLPLIAVVLFLLINHYGLIPPSYQNGWLYNLLTSIVVYLTFLIGCTNLIRVYTSLTGSTQPAQSWIVGISLVLFLIICGPAIGRIVRS
ncbi:NRAMP family divalent metal transporter [Rhodohalobacter mucosus]|uniref:NRAMP family divalent metal transporter n=1 Tax=Rhodohalobacter mucosus TaxID=2079485 RepID=UPI00130486B0|nr:divalent metal cation transporter [Rhodohalobacter mucosus]